MGNPERRHMQRNAAELAKVAQALNGAQLLNPNQELKVNINYSPGPNAHPLMVTQQSPGAVNLMAIGGLSKVEQLAGMISGHIIRSIDANLFRTAEQDVISPESKFPNPHQLNEAVAQRSVDVAEAIVEECERRQRERQELAAAAAQKEAEVGQAPQIIT